MYCLSQFCCFCFCSKVKLKPLQKITHHNATFLNIVFPELQLYKASRFLSICEDCVKFVNEVNTFRQNCIKNHFLLVDYIEQLGAFGGKFGKAQVQIKANDIETNRGKAKPWKGHEELFTIIHDAVKLYCDETTNITEEVNGDFNETYDYRDEIFEDWKQSRKLIDTNQSSSQITPFKCVMCGEFFKTRKFLDSHYEVHDRKYKVEEISKDLVQHVPTERKKQEEKPVECKKCGKSFNRRSNLQRHQKVHVRKTSHKCGKCGKSFKSNRLLSKHCKIHNFACENCGKSNHYGSKARCEHCGTSFLAKKSHKCQECGKYFRNQYDLKKHRVVHTGEKPFECKTCGKGFSFAASFKRHEMIHTGEKPYSCNVCGKAFIYPYLLKRHSLIHGTNRGNLKRRKRIRTENKSYDCNVCGKTFNYHCLLRRHSLVHANWKRSNHTEKPCKCKTCGKKFSRKFLFEIHLVHCNGENSDRRVTSQM